MAVRARLWRGLAPLWAPFWAPVLAVLALMAAPVGAETRLGMDEARRFAVALAQQGQPRAAKAAALALLQHDPDDVVALIVLARSARDLDELPAAKAAARRAFRLAEDDKTRFAAALAMAQALASGGQRTLAQFWLRRAAEVAPDARHRAVAVRDFAYVRARNPLRARFSFGAFPSSNVNDGPTTTTLVIGGIEFTNPEAVPLSGLGFATSFDLTRQWEVGPAAQISLGLAGEATQYLLSDAARAAVPGAQGSDFGSGSLGATLGWAHQDADRAVAAVLTLGRDWQGGAVLADWQRLRLSYGQALAPGQRLTLAASVTDTQRHDAALRSSRRAEVTLGWDWGAEGRDQWDLTLVLGRVASEAASVARRDGELRLGWQGAQPLAGVELSGFLSLGLRAYDRPLYIAEARHDVTARLGVTAVLTEIDYLGFAPEIGLTLSRTDSNVSAMTTEKAEVRLGIRSTF